MYFQIPTLEKTQTRPANQTSRCINETISSVIPNGMPGGCNSAVPFSVFAKETQACCSLQIVMPNRLISHYYLTDNGRRESLANIYFNIDRNSCVLFTVSSDRSIPNSKKVVTEPFVVIVYKVKGDWIFSSFTRFEIGKREHKAIPLLSLGAIESTMSNDSWNLKRSKRKSFAPYPSRVSVS